LFETNVPNGWHQVALAPLARLAELRLVGNPLVANNSDNYRRRVGSAVPQLQYLDDEFLAEADRRLKEEGT
jgi:hypothetical protein